MEKLVTAQQPYKFVRGSDVIRDGVYLELWQLGNPETQLAEVFYSDATRQYFLTCFQQDVPLEAIEQLLQMARRRLPDETQDGSAA